MMIKNKAMYCMECKEIFFIKNTKDLECKICGAPEIEILEWKDVLKNNANLPEKPSEGIKYDIF